LEPGLNADAYVFGDKEEERRDLEVHFRRGLPLTGAGVLHEQLCLTSSVLQVKTGVFGNFGLRPRNPPGSPKVYLTKHKIFYLTTAEMIGKVICTLKSPQDLP